MDNEVFFTVFTDRPVRLVWITRGGRIEREQVITYQPETVVGLSGVSAEAAAKDLTR